MLEILIMVLVAIAVETARRYFIMYRYCEEKFRRVDILPAILIVAGMALPYLWRDYIIPILPILLVVIFCLVDHLVCLIVAHLDYLKQRKKGIKEEEPTAEEEKLGEKQYRVFLLSYLLPILVCVAACIRVDVVDSRVFEQQWQQTEAVTILQEPVRTVIKGYEKVAFETENGDVVVGINDDNIDFLRMQKGDKIRHLEIGNRKRSEIVTLRGEAYQK